MAKSTRAGGGRMKQRTIVPGGAKNMNKPAFPNEGLPSNAVADKQANLIFIGGLVLGTLLLGAGLFWCVAVAVSGFNASNYLAMVIGIAGFVAMAFLGRGLVWMSIFGAVMYAHKSGAWEAQKALCERALRWKKFIPGGATTAGLLLIQGYMSRGQIDETIAIGQQQYEEFGQDPKQQQNLAPMYSALGLSYYMRGAWRDAITWNDRAIAAFNQLMDQFKNRKGFMAKLAGAQGDQWVKDMHAQLAIVHFNNGTSHFNLRNQRGAKESYRLAVEHANQAPDFNEKADLLRVSKEQLQRLKHA